MPQHFLNGPQIRAAVDKVRGKRMPKLVGSHVFWKPKVAQILFQFKLDKARIHFLSGRRAQYEIFGIFIRRKIVKPPA